MTELERQVRAAHAPHGIMRARYISVARSLKIFGDEAIALLVQFGLDPDQRIRGRAPRNGFRRKGAPCRRK